jgi:hypothetical protein
MRPLFGLKRYLSNGSGPNKRHSVPLTGRSLGALKTFQNEQTSKLAYLRVFSIGRLNVHCQH